jgi:hypothetical protein
LGEEILRLGDNNISGKLFVEIHVFQAIDHKASESSSREASRGDPTSGIDGYMLWRVLITFRDVVIPEQICPRNMATRYRNNQRELITADEGHVVMNHPFDNTTQ